jgi:lipopolysaccharide export LptBFGC system permease protein LptF
LRPFFTLAAACSLLTYLNFEVLLPSAMRHIDEFKIAHFQNSHVAKRRDQIHLIPLPDNTKLIYQSFDQEKNTLFDVVWIKSLDEMWRIKSLNANPQEPIAQYADHIVRNREGFFEKQDSFIKLRLQDLKWHPRMARKSLIPFEQRRLSELYQLRHWEKAAPYDLPKIKTALLFKLTIPLLSPLLVMAVAPFCLTTHRQRHFFSLYALGLFGLFATYMLLDALAILSENQVMAPALAIYTPFLFLIPFFSWRFFSKT